MQVLKGDAEAVLLPTDAASVYAVCAPYILNSGMGLLGGLNMPVGNDAKGAGSNRGRRARSLSRSS